MGCQVWWARASDARAAQLALLDPVERGRRERYRRAEDRDRFTVGVALSRTVLGARLGIAPARVGLDRTCPTCGEPHGRPVVAGDGAPRISVSHSGDRVALAVCAGAEVGVDVERVGERDLAIALTASERAALAGRPAADLIALWTRKEALLKATGDGLNVEPSTVEIADPPALAAFPARPELVGAVQLVDLDPGEGYRAALAVLSAAPVAVSELDGSALLAR